MKQKRLMLLGGLRYLLPVIEAAHSQGYYVITADYLPNNIAHKYSDEYVNVSVTDKDAVLREARRLEIDGIMSFAVDPGVIAASYVQNEMGLPSFGPFESICILQNKDRFRKFLSDNGFNVPIARSYKSVKDAMEDIEWLTFPMIVKPTDSAGSKGVTRVDNLEEYLSANEHAFNNSISGAIIVEQFIEKQGCSSDCECFSIDGELVFASFNSQHFDPEAPNPYTPAAFTWPSTFTKEQEAYLRGEIQRLISLLGMKTSIYNVETRVGIDGKPYIMEVSPRGGGNRLAEMVRYAIGVDLITACVRAAVGDPINKIEGCCLNGFWSEIILHSDKSGLFETLDIPDEYKPYIVETDLWVKPCDHVSDFKGANDAIGTLVMRFPDAEILENALQTQYNWIKVNVD